MRKKSIKSLNSLLSSYERSCLISASICPLDSKAISSFAKQKNKKQTADGRRDIDADYGRKVYKGKTKDGKQWEKIVKWFGYKLHLVVDATYELPITFRVTKASATDIKEGHALLAQMEEKQPEILKTAKKRTCLPEKTT